MRKSAYYSRNNSYSRSFNAECAERENRYPLTRAAAYLGISLAAFKNGLSHSGISTNEWHHVGKYANHVDYYDVSESGEIVNSFSFWKGATTKANVWFCKKEMRRIAYESMIAKTSAPFIMPSRFYDGSIISTPYPMTDKAMWRQVRKALADKRCEASKAPLHPDKVYLTTCGKVGYINTSLCGRLDYNNNLVNDQYIDLSEYEYTGSSNSGHTHYFIKK